MKMEREIQDCIIRDRILVICWSTSSNNPKKQYWWSSIPQYGGWVIGELLEML